jgi:hypothetical protein
MKRAVVTAAVLAALGAAAPAAGDVPPVHGGSVLGKNLPLKVYAAVDPPVHLFADAITASVAVVADRRWVAPANLRVAANFAPYQPTGPPTEVRTTSGRLLQVTWTWKLLCLTTRCLPVTKGSDFSDAFQLHPAQVAYLSPRGTLRYALNARWQRIEALSQLSPSEIAALGRHTLEWEYQLTPLPAPRYRLSPGLLFWLSVALASILGGAGLAIAGRWARQFRPARAEASARDASPLERALALFFWARANDDETLQRKALERVADELPFDVHELSETARALAWSRETPEEEEVEEISERAGIHRRDREAEL